VPVTVLAVAAAVGLAVWLALPSGARLQNDRRGWAEGAMSVRGVRQAVLVAVVAGGLVTLLEGTTLVLALVGAAAVAGGWRMLARSRARRAAQQRADAVVELCEALAGELRAGQPPLRALRHGVEVWPELEPVATAGELGADVPKALRRLAALPGASGLLAVASAWQVSQGSGGTMASALSRVADSSRAQRTTQRLVASELASAQATARLVAVLPVVVLAMGSGLGGDPWGFLLTTPVGLACLTAGLLLAYAGLAWIEAIAGKAVDP